MPDEPDLPRKFYGLKPKEFERVNPPADSSSTSDSPSHPNAENTADQPIDVREIAREAMRRSKPPPDRTHTSPNRENDVHVILRENLNQANTAGLNEVSYRPPQRSQRKRDYVVALIAGNVVLAGCFLIAPIFGGAGIVIYNVGLTWVMWVVMDDY